MTAEETIASLETRLKQALERLEEVSEQLRVAQARREELEEVSEQFPVSQARREKQEQLKTQPPAIDKDNEKKPEGKREKPRKKGEAQLDQGPRRRQRARVIELG